MNCPTTATTPRPVNLSSLTEAERHRLESLLQTKTLPSSGGCLDWQGGSKSTAEGYGVIWFRGRSDRVHRVFVMLNGSDYPRPAEVVRHLCGNSRCVNPEHLVTGTSSENNQDTWSHGHQPERTGLTAEDEEIIRIHAAWGYSSWKIAEEWFLCRSTVLRFMRQHGLGVYEQEEDHAVPMETQSTWDHDD